MTGGRILLMHEMRKQASNRAKRIPADVSKRIRKSLRKHTKYLIPKGIRCEKL